MRDELFSNQLESIQTFRFDQKTAAVFDDMIHRSVPGYDHIVTGITDWLEQLTSLSTVYDLGCATGFCSGSILKRFQSPITLYAIDNSAAMIQHAQDTLASFKNQHTVHYRQQDICTLHFEPCDAIILNFTLQFIEVDKRQPLLQKIFDALNAGGILLLSDKMHHLDPTIQAGQEQLHHRFKKHQGYSDLEIAQKRQSLENYLQTETIEAYHQRLQSIGFTNIQMWYYNRLFASFCALKV